MEASPKAGAIALVHLAVLFIIIPVSAADDKRPFWAEKSAFVEGNDLFVVGVASKARSAEEGRQQAFEHGKTELMNYAQVTNLEAQGLVIETQMTYEENNPDGTVNVYRLLRVPAAKLIAIQGRLQTQTLAQSQVLEKTRQELSRQQIDLESKSRSIQESLDKVTQLQKTLSEKAQRINDQQQQVEQLLQQLSLKLEVKGQATPLPNTSKGAQSTSSMMESLTTVEAQLDAQEKDLARISQRARERINKEVDINRKRCRHILKGMTKGEIRELMGDPDDVPSFRNYWSYGKKDLIFIYFNDSGGVSDMSGCSGNVIK